MRILIDTREKNRINSARKFYAKKRHDVKITKLNFGDYIFEDTVAFEYKQISDMMSSIADESVFHEVYNQSAIFPFSYIIIVGDVKALCKEQWKIAAIRKAFHNNYGRFLYTKMKLYYGALRRLRTVTCPIIVESEETAFEEMLLQAEKCLDKKAYAGVVRPVPSQDVVDLVLCGISGISSKKAEAIRNHHNINNLYDLMRLTIEDLKAVNSIGEKLAKNIYEFVHKGE